MFRRKDPQMKFVFWSNLFNNDTSTLVPLTSLRRLGAGHDVWQMFKISDVPLNYSGLKRREFEEIVN